MLGSKTDPRDLYIAQVVAGKTFVDVGDLWGMVNEKVTVAAKAGAARTAMLDITPLDRPLWQAFRERRASRGVSDCQLLSASIDEPGLERRVGQFDVVHCSGVLYRCPNPLHTLSQLARISRVLTSILVLLPASWMIFSCVTTVGLAKVYQLRYIHSRLQLEALVQQIPAHTLPRDTVLAPVHLEENSVSRVGTFAWAGTLDRLLFGVFEISWSATPACQVVYARPDLRVITTHRWANGLHFTGFHDSSERCEPGDVEIELEGQPVCSSRLLAFTYQDQKVILANPLILAYPDGRRIEVALPLAVSLVQSGVPGSPLEIHWRAAP